ncbi:MAG: GCN5 family acetyltransferase [Treponema sp.]|nr:GCN5 family acetyltransferase [Treponema sp.]
MPLVLRHVESRRDLSAFIAFPSELFRRNPYYVPVLRFDDRNTLDPRRNAAFEFCEASYWLAEIEGRVVGRVAAIINRRYIEKWGNKYARFGWMDFIEDFEVAKALLGVAEGWARERGMEGMHGPLGFTDLDREGLLVEGYDRVATLATIWNPPYYVKYLERLGYSKDCDWVEFLIPVPDEVPEKVRRVNAILAKRTGVRIFEWKSKKALAARYAKDLFALIDEAYAGLYGTTPLSPRQVEAYTAQYFGFVDPRFTKVLVDEEDRLVGFGIAMPSLSRALQRSRGRLLPLGWLHLLLALRKPEILDLYLVGVKKEWQSRGIVALLLSSINESAREAGIKFAESNPELEDNIAVQGLWNAHERTRHKRRRVYLKRL